ncbi:MAG: 5'-3' exonuclease [Actinomycetota bacterium]|nr:5'-3' exonuclease [Actinomycetota bacterium]
MTPAPHGSTRAKPDLMILDTASLYYRSFYALPSPMTAPDGFPHNAIRGLLQTIERLRERFDPTTLIAAWDTDWRPGWRVELLPSYKTHRLADPTTDEEDEPDELGPQIGAIHQILWAWGIPVVGVEGFEADDVAGTLSHLAAKNNLSTVIVTGDRDFVQLVDDATHVLMTVKGGMDAWPLLNTEVVIERFGVSPAQYLDVATLRGDPSDGLPGVHGVGDKTAVRLIQQFGDLTGVQQACNEEPLIKPLTPRLAGLINDHADYLATAKAVSAIRQDVPIPDANKLLRQPIPASPQDPKAWETAVDEWGVRRFAESAMKARN